VAEVVIGRWHPTPGQKLDTFEVPGPGLYEADFFVPDWLVPDFQSARQVQRKIGEHRVSILGVRSEGNTATLRFRIERIEDTTNAPDIASGPVIALAAVVGLLGGLIFGWLALKELRRIAETPAGIGLAALGLGAGALLLVGALKGR